MTMDYVHNLMDYYDPVVESDDPEDIPHFKDVLIEDCVCTGGNIGVVIHGLKDKPETISNITIRNCALRTQLKADLADCEDVQIIDGGI
ncbi:MAG: hypothetical protein IJB96_04805 [Lachnospira sp.]|nr:hypothetical protein [Lachnospira sp.]